MRDSLLTRGILSCSFLPAVERARKGEPKFLTLPQLGLCTQRASDGGKKAEAVSGTELQIGQLDGWGPSTRPEFCCLVTVFMV